MNTYKIGDIIYDTDNYNKPTIKATVIEIPSFEEHINHYRSAGYWADLYKIRTEDNREYIIEEPCCTTIDVLAYE